MTGEIRRPSVLRRVVRWGVRGLRVAAACLAVAVVAAVAGLPVYAFPQVDKLRHADAVFVLGGFGWERNEFGIDLAKQGWAPVVVVSMWNPANDPARTRDCEFPEPGITKICVAADPPTTLGEARQLRRLATEHGWHTIIAVTFRPHISRARYILEGCFDGQLIMVTSPARLTPARWAYEYLYQTGGYLRTLFHPHC